MKIERILLGRGSVETLEYFMDGLLEGIKEMGLEVWNMEFANPSSYTSPEFYAFLEKGACLVLSFNFLFSDRKTDTGMPFWEDYQIPYVTILVDHPRFFADRLADFAEGQMVACVDRRHMEYLKRYEHLSEKQLLFLPHGGRETIQIPYEERDISILYVGNCQQELLEAPLLQGYEEYQQDFYSRIPEQMIHNPDRNIEDLMEEFFQKRKQILMEEDLKKINEIHGTYLEWIVRRLYKQRFLRLIDLRQLPIEIYGDDWEASDYCYGDCIHIHERISSEECNRLAGRAKICVNFLPWFKDGANERVFNSLLAGSLLFTDTSEYLLEQFRQERELVFFELNHLTDMVERIEYYLKHPKEAKEIAMRGQRIAREKHLWKHRMKELLARLLQEEVYEYHDCY